MIEELELLSIQLTPLPMLVLRCNLVIELDDTQLLAEFIGF
jgi:hypothetical protein